MSVENPNEDVYNYATTMTKRHSETNLFTKCGWLLVSEVSGMACPPKPIGNITPQHQPNVPV